MFPTNSFSVFPSNFRNFPSFSSCVLLIIFFNFITFFLRYYFLSFAAHLLLFFTFSRTIQLFWPFIFLFLTPHSFRSIITLLRSVWRLRYQYLLLPWFSSLVYSYSHTIKRANTSVLQMQYIKLFLKVYTQRFFKDNVTNSREIHAFIPCRLNTVGLLLLTLQPRINSKQKLIWKARWCVKRSFEFQKYFCIGNNGFFFSSLFPVFYTD